MVFGIRGFRGGTVSGEDTVQVGRSKNRQEGEGQKAPESQALQRIWDFSRRAEGGQRNVKQGRLLPPFRSKAFRGRERKSL